MAEKKVPLRRCAGCNEQREKRALVRVVRTPEGSVILDTTGKANGRGVYLCPSAACLQKAKKARRLERNLDTPIPDEVWTRLEEAMAHAEG